MKTFFARLHKDADSAYGLEFPDAPGCYAAGDTVDETLGSAVEALRLWAEAEESAGREVPAPRSLEALRAAGSGDELAWIGVPLLADAGRSVRVSITMDAGLLEAVDQTAAARGVTRSAFLADAARQKIGG